IHSVPTPEFFTVMGRNTKILNVRIKIEIVGDIWSDIDYCFNVLFLKKCFRFCSSETSQPNIWQYFHSYLITTRIHYYNVKKIFFVARKNYICEKSEQLQ